MADENAAICLKAIQEGLQSGRNGKADNKRVNGNPPFSTQVSKLILSLPHRKGKSVGTLLALPSDPFTFLREGR